MNVLVIPEDFRKDQYMLKPIIEAMLKAKGKIVKVRVCQDPLLGGIRQALNWELIENIINRYKYRVQLFLLCVDRDGDSGRRVALNRMESQARQVLSVDKLFLAENAWQEIEVWVLAGHNNLPQEWVWADVRTEVHPKETYFEPFAERKGVLDTPDQGRKILAEEAARNYPRIRMLCEEITTLEERIP